MRWAEQDQLYGDLAAGLHRGLFDLAEVRQRLDAAGVAATAEPADVRMQIRLALMSEQLAPGSGAAAARVAREVALRCDVGGNGDWGTVDVVAAADYALALLLSCAEDAA